MMLVKERWPRCAPSRITSARNAGWQAFGIVAGFDVIELLSMSDYENYRSCQGVTWWSLLTPVTFTGTKIKSLN